MSRPGARRTAASLLAFGLALVAPGLATAQRPELDPALVQAMQQPIPVDGLAVIVMLRDADMPRLGRGRRAAIQQRQQRVLKRFRKRAFRLRHRHRELAGMAGRASRRALRRLARDPDVQRIYLDGEVHATLAEGVSLVEGVLADTKGFRGLGVAVAVLDTGFDTDHPDISDALVAEKCYCGPPDCCPSGSEQSGPGAAEDDAGHGTAVSGIITSSRVAGPGLAPDSGIVAIKVLNGGGGGSFSDIDAALDWVLANAATYGIRVVNMSLGNGGQYNSSAVFPCSGTLTANVIASLNSAGVAVVVSSGNDAHSAGVSFPACVAGAISVGGVYDASLGTVGWCGNSLCSVLLCSDPSTAPDSFVCHSNSGSILDVLAPNWRTTTAGIGGGTTNFGGTSAAAPYAAAAAAVLFAADPSLTPEDVRTLLTSYGPMVLNPANSLSFRRTDLAAALTAVVAGPDSDVDGISDDGDGSGVAGDDPCETGEVSLCDDNCALASNSGQSDVGGVGGGSPPDGIGGACQCGDLDGDEFVSTVDVDVLRLHLVDPIGSPLSAAAESLCALHAGSSDCDLTQVAILLRSLESPPLAPGIAPACDAALGF
jgi:hypothetical protein